MYRRYVSPICLDPRPGGSEGDIMEEERCKEGLERNPRILPRFYAIALDGALLALVSLSGRPAGRSIARGGGRRGDLSRARG